MTLNFFERFQENVSRFPERPAFQHLLQEGKEVFSYRRVAQEVAAIGAFLKRSGIEPGQSVGILMENQPRWGIAFMAAESAGAVLVPLDILHGAEMLARLIRHSGCVYLIVSAAQLRLARKALHCLDQPLPLLVVGDSEGNEVEWDEVLGRESKVPNVLPIVKGELDDPNIIMYTSGTTGDPKGVVLTRRNIYRNVTAALTTIEVGPEDHLLGVLPLYHILALMVNFIIPLYAGARVTFLDVLEAQKILDTFRREGITIFVCVPQFYYLLHQKIFQEVEKQGRLKRMLFHRLLALSGLVWERTGWSPGKVFFPAVKKPFGGRLRFFGVGGARFDKDIDRSFRCLGFEFLQAYGMTETAAIATITPPRKAPPGTVGKALPHDEIKIERPDSSGIGEVLIRGENVMKGYLNNPQATAQAIDEDGWLHSGDLGYLDRQGYLFITGRKKDVIVLSSGKNIYPEEIEEFYQQQCPFIKEICVLGVADSTSSEGQERLHAVIVPDFEYLKSQQVVNASDMIRYMLETISQKLPPYKRVHSFTISQQPLPRTTTRKIKRFEVQQILEQKRPEPEPDTVESYQPQSTVEEEIFRHIGQMKKGARVHPKMNLELDLGFDSLERVELLSSLEQHFQIQVPEQRGGELFTVADLIKVVEDFFSEEAVQQEGSVRKSWGEILQEPLLEEEQKEVAARLARSVLVEWLFLMVARLILFGILKPLFRLKVKGLENLPCRYPFMICPNHLSFLDAFVVVGPMPARIIFRLFSLGYADYFQTGILSFLGRLIKIIPVDSERHLRRALRLAAEGLRKDLVLCVFPEGERSIDGSLKRFRKGPAILAVETGIPVVPVGITGTFEVWSRGSGKIRLHPVTVRFGKPIRPSAGESYEDFNSRLFEAVKALHTSP